MLFHFFLFFPSPKALLLKAEKEYPVHFDNEMLLTN